MKLVTEAYIGYTSTNDEIFKVPVSLLKKSIKPSNFNKMDYIRYVAPAFTYIMSIHAYWTEVKRFKDFTKLNESQVIISDEQLAEAIGCHVNTAGRVMKTLQTIFDLKFTRVHEQGGARIVTINNRVIEFLKIYSYEEFYMFIEQYNLGDKKVSKALQQLFRYRAWGVKPKYLKPSQQEARSAFMKKMKNFFHIASTNNVSNNKRIEFIKANKDKISDYNSTQLDRIIEENKEGKLSHYWFNLLVRLYQKVTMAIKSIMLTKKQQETEAQTNSRIDNESNPGETVVHASATQKAQRLPEDTDITPNDYMEIMIEWNNMLSSNDIPNIDALNQNVINAINTHVKSIGKRELIECIRKVPGLNSVQEGTFKMTFKKFMTVKTINLLKSLDITVEPRIESSWLDDHMLSEYGLVSVPMINLDEVPVFESTDTAAAWWNQHTTK
jgi:hypothetical protein